MVATSGSGDITGNVIFGPTSIKLTSFSQRWLNRFGQSWTCLKTEMFAQFKFKWIITVTSGSGDLTGNVSFRPALHELTSVSRRWLNRFEQSWARLKFEILSQIKCKWIMAATSGSADITGNVIFIPTSIKLSSFPRSCLNRCGQSGAR